MAESTVPPARDGYDDDDDVMMMEWAFDETLQEATKGYGNDAIDATAPSRYLVTRQHV